jgi:hypothetical protein
LKSTCKYKFSSTITFTKQSSVEPSGINQVGVSFPNGIVIFIICTFDQSASDHVILLLMGCQKVAQVHFICCMPYLKNHSSFFLALKSSIYIEVQIKMIVITFFLYSWSFATGHSLKAPAFFLVTF